MSSGLICSRWMRGLLSNKRGLKEQMQDFVERRNSRPTQGWSWRCLLRESGVGCRLLLGKDEQLGLFCASLYRVAN